MLHQFYFVPLTSTRPSRLGKRSLILRMVDVCNIADYAGGQHDGDNPRWSLEEARIWRVLAGDYLADKGFRIHDMLARYNASLYKPPIAAEAWLS